MYKHHALRTGNLLQGVKQFTDEFCF